MTHKYISRPDICVNHCQYGFISKAEKLYRFFVIGVVFIFPILYIFHTFCYLVSHMIYIV